MHCKLQTRPLVRDCALHEETNKYQTKEQLKSSHGLQRGTQTKRNWPTDHWSQNPLELPESVCVCVCWDWQIQWLLWELQTEQQEKLVAESPPFETELVDWWRCMRPRRPSACEVNWRKTVWNSDSAIDYNWELAIAQEWSVLKNCVKCVQ
jgi:hypothetical protein